MMDQLFPYANIIAGVMIFIVGFVFHWLGQLISIVNWEFATRIGLQEKNAPSEYKIYEHGIASADVVIGWLYGVVAIGLMFNVTWSVKLAWVPGVIFVYHGISFWFWTANQKKAGIQLTPTNARIGWLVANIATGVLAILIAWKGS